MQPLAKDERCEYEDGGGDDFGMDWDGCGDDVWEDGDAGEGVIGGGSDSVKSSTADDERKGRRLGPGTTEEPMEVKKEDHKEEPEMDEEKTVVYVHMYA